MSTRGYLASISMSVWFCLNVLHVYHLCAEYLKYDVTTDVQLIIPDVIEVPKMTLCYDKQRLVRWNKLNPYEVQHLFNGTEVNQSASFFNDNLFHDLLHDNEKLEILRQNMESGEIGFPRLFDITMPVEEILSTLHLTVVDSRSPSGFRYYKEIDFNIASHEYKSHIEIDTIWIDDPCFSVSLQKQHRFLNYRELLRESDGYIAVIFIPVNLTNLVTTYLILTPNNHDIPLGSYSYRLLPMSQSRNQSNEYYTSITTYESFLLEPPYKTECYKYPGEMTRIECHHSCVKKESHSRVKRIPHLSTVYISEEYNLIPKK